MDSQILSIKQVTMLRRLTMTLFTFCLHSMICYLFGMINSQYFKTTMCQCKILKESYIEQITHHLNIFILMTFRSLSRFLDESK